MKSLLGIVFLLWVLAGAAAGLPAVILGLAPNTGNPGQTFMVDIRGLVFPATISTASVTFGSGITVTSAQRLPDEVQDIDGQAVNVNSIRVQITISPAAYAGTRAVRVGSVASFAAAAFTVVNPSAPPPPGADLAFNQQSDIPAMAGPNEVAAHDFTGDSLIDLAVGAPGQNSLLLYTGLAAGRFGGPKRIRNDNAVASLVEIVDMNGDGKADLVTGDENAPRVEIWINSFGLTFRKPAHVDIPASPWGLAVGDFNGDGRKDVVVAARDIDRAVLLLGSASGAFEPPRALASGITPKAAASGDFDRDGLEDAVVANYTNGISIYKGSRSTGLLPQKRKPSPVPLEKVICVDLNGDNLLDIAAIGGDSVVLFRGKGNGDFFPPKRLRIAPFVWNLAAADFNKDGKMDLAIINRASGQLSILAGLGNFAFSKPLTYKTGDQPLALATGDFNRDSRIDLVVTNFESNNLSVYLNTTGNP